MSDIGAGEEPGARYMLQVRRRGRWRDWWPDLVGLEQVEQAGGFDGIVAGLREAPRPVTGQVRLVLWRREDAWLPLGVVAFRDKAGRY